jgi:TolB-like protein/class 3 adenylate cyclase/predicted Zn-dependent protease
VVEHRVERKLAAILAADVAGYSRLTGADEEGTLARLRALRKDLVDPTIVTHHGHIVKTTGDGMLVEFASVVDAARCAVELQRQMTVQNADIAADEQINFRIGINLGDVVVESDGDLMGDGVNVAARLEGIASPGGICLSRAAYDQVKGKISVAMHDRGEHRLKNIAEPVQVFAVDLDGVAMPPRVKTGVQLAAIAAATILVLAGGGAWYLRGGVGANSATPETARANASAKTAPSMSVVVLPFANLSTDHEQDYFADAITESLTTDLSRIQGSFVIARNTAFTYKGKAIDVRKIGRELGVRYALEGSVQRAGAQVRVNAQLIDTETGGHVWSDRLDYELSDLLKLQNTITGRLARALSLELVDAESKRTRRERPNNPDAIDLLMQASAAWARTRPGEDKIPARNLFRRALDRDDGLSGAWSGLAATYLQESRLSATRDDDLREAAHAIERSLALDSKNAAAFHAKAVLDYELKDIKGAIQNDEASLALDRNCAPCWSQIGASKVLLGESSQAFAYIDRALELSPRDPATPVWYLYKGAAYLHLQDDEKAIEWMEKSKQLNPRAGLTRLFLASALALAGRDADAQTEMHEFLRLNPGFTLSLFKARDPSSNALFLAQRQRIYEGARKAGLPEQ